MSESISPNHSAVSQDHDVIIIGGGPVGLLTAYMLTRKQFRVALIDRLDYQDVLDANFDGRTFAYAYGSRKILEDVGLWDNLETHATPIKDIYVTADHKNFLPESGLHYEAKRITVDGFQNHNQSNQNGLENAMGYNIETRHFRRHVFAALENNPLFTLFAPQTIESTSFHEFQSTVTLTDGTTLQAPLTIGCDGKNSALRKNVGITTKTMDYQQKALVGLIRHSHSHNNTAYEHFLKSGPLAILPMQDDSQGRHQSGFIWSLKSDRADHFYNLDDAALNSELHSYFGKILGEISIFGNRWLFPLDAKIVANYVADRLVLVGDSAHAIHPVAGQGFNLGIRDAYALTNHLVERRNLGLDYGTKTSLKTYEALRRTDVLSMTSMCHGLVRLFSNDIRSLDHLRKAGLRLTNSVPALKDQLTKHAMGLKN